jgi:hypothetical protein
MMRIRAIHWIFLSMALLSACQRISTYSPVVPTPTKSYLLYNEDDFTRVRATQQNGRIAEWQAIELAKIECYYAHSKPSIVLEVVRAELMAYGKWANIEEPADVRQDIGNSQQVWTVELKGSWVHEGGPAMDESGNKDNPRPSFNRCRLIINANTGDSYSVRSWNE